MSSGHGRWIREGGAWKIVLDSLGIPLKKWAEQNRAEFARERWDAPELEVRWQSAGITRAIQVLITGSPDAYELEINASAWKDVDPERQRKWHTDTLRTLSIPRDLSQLNVDEYVDAFKDAQEQVSRWADDKLERTASLPRREA